MNAENNLGRTAAQLGAFFGKFFMKHKGNSST